MNSFLKKLIKSPIILSFLLMAVVAFALLYGTLKWLETYTLHNRAIVIPDVKGLTEEKAAPFFENVGLRYNVIDSVYSRETAPGAIVEIIPSVGSKVKEGRIVFLTLNAHTAQMAVIPDVEDISFRQAYALLRARGFNRIEIGYVPGDFKDLVICVEQDGRILNRGEMVPLAATLMLRVSNGEDRLPAVDTLGLSVDSIPLLDSLGGNRF